MKKKLIVAVLVCFAIVLTAAIASAAPFHHFDSQIAKQQRSIDRGIASGKLTQNEAAILQDNLNHVKGRLDRYRANDGRLDPRERVILQKMLDRNSRMIRKMKHNAIQRVY
jgi:peptidoglycan hydrolase CwlO-like protein